MHVTVVYAASLHSVQTAAPDSYHRDVQVDRGAAMRALQETLAEAEARAADLQRELAVAEQHAQDAEASAQSAQQAEHAALQVATAHGNDFCTHTAYVDSRAVPGSADPAVRAGAGMHPGRAWSAALTT